MVIYYAIDDGSENGRLLRFDEEDVALLEPYTWQLDAHGYMVSKGVYKKQISMSRLIMGCVKGDGKIVDHIDRDTLNNCRNNLRIVTRAQNGVNSKRLNGGKYSRYTGVSKIKGRWRATAQFAIGTFDTEMEAAIAYDDWAITQYGDSYTPNLDNTKLIDKIFKQEEIND